ncbi:hypothetical protein [Mesorhizobium sp.]|uniref:hypothetical protein n=1 Tax=Mesorhizobium sp. TaxID=1871066 RepID=UPI0035665C3B
MFIDSDDNFVITSLNVKPAMAINMNNALRTLEERAKATTTLLCAKPVAASHESAM